MTFATSTNGIAEYTASNFNNALKGNLLAADLNFGKIFNLTFTADGTNVTNIKTAAQKLYDDVPFASGFGTEPLDITAQGDSAVFPGTVWTCTYKTQAITIFEPQDFLNCTGLYNSEDDDSDGYTNADEKDNATNPCSAASKPNDFDHDQLSNINDPDDDNDGITDNIDYFAIEATNGLTTRPAITYNLFNNDPGTGFFGLGFTGLMCNRLPANDYIKNFNEDSLIAGGAVGAFSIVATTQGDALGTLNNQQNAFHFGVRPEAGTGPFTVNGRISGPFFNNNLPVGFQSQGIYIGTGDQSNYIKIALNESAGALGIQVIHEAGDVPVIQQFTFSGSTSSTSVNFFFTINPVTGTVQPKYAVNGGAVVNLGAPLALSGPLLSAIQGPAALAVGVISTARGGASFVATWDYIYITFDPIVAGGVWQTVAPVSGMPIARKGNGYVEAGNKFYLIGGRNTDSVQVYDAAAKLWQNKAKPPMELLDFQAVVHEGLIYVAGAFTGAFPRETPVSQVYIFNPLTDKWFAGSTIPIGRRRGSTGTVVYKNKIYMIGGIQDGHWTGSVSWFDEYDPVSNVWKNMPDAPRARDHFHASIINDKLYLAGGRRSSGSTAQHYSLTIPEIDVFDFNSGLWSTLPSSANLPTPRAGAATAVLGNELLVIGGESAQATAHIETEALNLETNTWRRLADLQQKRHSTQVIKSNNGLYLAAGAANPGSSNPLASQEAFYLSNPTVPNGALLTQSQLTPIPNLSFGSLPVNMDSTKVITLNNTGGNQAILISSVNITGANSFTSTTPFPLPFVLAAGKSINISVKFKPAVSGTQTATLVITHSGAGGSTSTSLSGAVNTPVYLINAGGGQVNTLIGMFAPDAYYSPVPGNTGSVTSPIAGTTDDAIYQTERFNSNGAFSYAFPVSNGQYVVILHFAEIFFTTPGSRIFDVTLEGAKVLDNFDIVKKAGAFSATTENFLVTVSDGTLNLSLSSLAIDGGINSPKISAIEIQRTSNQAPASNAGPDKTITLPVNTTSLGGSGTYADGTVTVTDAMLNLYLSSLAVDGGTNSPKISAIEVLSGSRQSMAAGMFSGNRSGVTNTTDRDAAVAKLSVKVLPNPSLVQFTFQFKSGSDKPVNMRIFNTTGVLIDRRSNIPANGTIRLGNNYLPGLYHAEVRQGNQKVRVTFVKLSP